MVQTYYTIPRSEVDFMQEIEINRERFDHKNPVRAKYKAKAGLSEDIVKKISERKNEPEWMLDFRLNAFRVFKKMPLPTWGPDLSKLDLDSISYFLDPDAKKNSNKWEDVPEDIRNTFQKLGIPEAEQKSLAGVGAQYESSSIYHNLKKQWEEKGIIFIDCDVAVKEYPEYIKKYFMTTCVPTTLHKFAALHGAVWSGGSFIYIPKNVKLELPLQAYFRMNAESMGQFEHTLIVADEGASVHYIEGCSAPQHLSSSLHAGCVEIHVLKNTRVRYSSIENWSKNTYNLNTKRAMVHENAVIEWVNSNMGSNVTMLYPTSMLIGRKAKSDYIGIAFAGKDQNQDTGHKVYHLAEKTSSTVTSKSISKCGGITSYRGLLKMRKGVPGSKSSVRCDALIMDNLSKSNTFPYMEIKEKNSDVAHEATVGKISADQIFYLMSRGLTEEQATQMIVSGFIEPIVKELPLEYAVELNRLMEMEMEGSLG